MVLGPWQAAWGCGGFRVLSQQLSGERERVFPHDGSLTWQGSEGRRIRVHSSMREGGRPACDEGCECGLSKIGGTALAFV